MDVSSIIKLIGRGREGARSSDRASAAQLFTELLEGSVPDLELGALLLAWRIKGESVDELAGFLQATQSQLELIDCGPAHPIDCGGPAPTRAVVIPSYNGARRLPNRVAWLARALRDRGIPVLVHGVRTDPARVTTAQVLSELGSPPCESITEASDRLARERLAFVPLDVLCAGLDRLLQLRWRLGVRHCAHTVAKMLQPLKQPALHLLSVTHPEYLRAMRDYYAVYPAQVLLMRGTEGEPIAHPYRAQAIEWLHEGRVDTLIAAATDSAPGPPEPPGQITAHDTATWVRQALAGTSTVPAPLRAQLEAIVSLCNRDQ